MPLKDSLRKLSKLYSLTGEDWVLSVHHILTEPTCPTAIIRREGSNAMRYRTDEDDIETAIEAAVDLVYREVVLGQPIDPKTPITNSDDHPDDPRWQATRETDILKQIEVAIYGSEPLTEALLVTAANRIRDLEDENEELKLTLSARRKTRQIDS